MEDVRSAILDRIDHVKENLRDADDKFKKLYGHNPDARPMRRPSDRGDDHVRTAGRLFGEARRIINNPNREPIRGRGEDGPIRLNRRVSQEDNRLGSIRSRLGPAVNRRSRESRENRQAVDRELEGDDADDETPVKTIQSSIIPTTKPILKREDSMAMQTDKKNIGRNRRMFGALLGTLQKFQSESKNVDERVKRRAELEKSVEKKQIREKVQMKEERVALLNERRAQENEIQHLQHKMRLVRAYEYWERETRKHGNFIKTTRARRAIFYMPKKMLPANEKALATTKRYVEDLITSRKKGMEKDIAAMILRRDQDKMRRRERREERREVRRDRPEDSKKSAEEESSSSSGSSSGSDTDSESEGELEEGELRSKKRQFSVSPPRADPSKVKSEPAEKVSKPRSPRKSRSKSRERKSLSKSRDRNSRSRSVRSSSSSSDSSGSSNSSRSRSRSRNRSPPPPPPKVEKPSKSPSPKRRPAKSRSRSNTPNSNAARPSFLTRKSRSKSRSRSRSSSPKLTSRKRGHSKSLSRSPAPKRKSNTKNKNTNNADKGKYSGSESSSGSSSDSGSSSSGSGSDSSSDNE